MPPNSTKCEVTSCTGTTPDWPETPQTKLTPGTTSPDVPQTTPWTISDEPETSQTELTLGITSADVSLTPYRKKNRALWGLEHVVVGLETSFFDEPANEFRGSTWQTPPKAFPPTLSPNDRLVIDILVSAQEELQEVPVKDFKSIQPFPEWEEQYDGTVEDKWKHLTQLVNLQLKLGLEFCQRLPGVREISDNDVPRLYEGHGEMLLFIRYARKYDQSIDAIRLVHGEPPYKKRHFRHLYRTSANEALFHLLRTKMVELKLDEVEYALFQAIVFFTCLPDLERPKLVWMQQQHYARILSDYMQATPSRLVQLFDTYTDMNSLKGNMRPSKSSLHQLTSG